MSVIHNDLLLSGDDGYNLTRSLRFRSSASAYLNRTFGTPTNNKIYTFSFWIKRGSLNSRVDIITDNNTSSISTIGFQSDSLVLQVGNGSGSAYIISSAVYRDPSAWYHIVGAVDTTQATDSNRLKMYVNGVQVTALQATVYPTQNFNPSFNSASSIGNIGRYNGGGYFDGYLTEVNFIDGQALTPSSFGEYSTQTGVWQAKKYSGTYGTNGFYLPFTDNSALTSGSNAGLGKDFSGNGNYWNTNNISITSGSTYDSMTDVPTVGELASNYAVLNPILQNGWWAAPNRGSISNGNLRLSQNNGTAFSTFDVTTSGKWYLEGTVTSYGQTSSNSEFVVSAKSRSTFEVSYLANGQKTVNASNSSYGSSWTTGDVIGIAIDPANNQVTYYKNGVSQGAITNTFPSETVLVGYYAEATGTDTIDFNFGQRPFAYTPPTGYVALNTYNLPTPTIGATASTQANKYFTPLVYTGNGTNNRAITGVGFQPDLVWTKCRSTGYNNNIADVVRGANKTLYSNTTDAEATNNGAGYVSAFSSDGYTVTQGVDMNQVNANGDTYVSWNWKANGSGSTNTAGSITSTVSANTTSGFSVVTYTTDGGVDTIGHGLGVAPKMIILKSRNNTSGWNTYHASVGNTGALNLQTTGATSTSVDWWNNTSPTSSVFTIGANINISGWTWVAYCFAEVTGFSKFGSYTGNGSSDGTFVYTGFRPKFLMIKRTDTSGDSWFVQDSSRSSYNVVSEYLLPNSSDSAASYNSMDFLSNGFKIRATGSGYNASNGNYIYMAFAEAPTKFALAR